MKIYPFKAIYPKASLLASVDSFLNNVKYKFPEFVQSGYFQKHNKEALYVCKISKHGKDHVGLIASTDIREIINGNVIKHENTLALKEQDTMNYILQRQAMIKPVLLAHQEVAPLKQLYKKVMAKKKPFHVAHAEIRGITQSFYAIENKATITEIQKTLSSKIAKSYIADGHHRCSTTALLYKNKSDKKSILSFSRILTAYFSFDELEIRDYNRIVALPPEMSYTQLLVHMTKYCNIKPLTEARKPKKKHEMTVFINNEWYSITWKSTTLKESKKDIQLDVDLFNQLILSYVYQSQETQLEKKIKYISGPTSLEQLIDKTNRYEHKFAICLYPVEMGEFIKISDKGKTLPPKSTWFEPRLHNGLIVQSFLK